MASEIVSHISNIVWQTQLPTSPKITPQAQTRYQQALDIVYSWRGDWRVLLEALKVFIATQSGAYANAGVALIISTAGYISDGKYEPVAGQKALKWLETAQNIDPNRGEINFIEALIYTRLERFQDARAVLNEIERTYTDYPVCMTEIAYWDKLGDIEQIKLWSTGAIKYSTNDVQRINLMNSVAGAFVRMRLYPEALETYKQIIQLTPKDPWAWHNISFIYLNTKKYDQARVYNQRALKLMDFQAARNIRDILKTKPKG